MQKTFIFHQRRKGAGTVYPKCNLLQAQCFLNHLWTENSTGGPLWGTVPELLTGLGQVLATRMPPWRFRDLILQEADSL